MKASAVMCSNSLCRSHCRLPSPASSIDVRAAPRRPANSRENARDRNAPTLRLSRCCWKARRRRHDADPEPARADERAQYRAHRGVVRRGSAARRRIPTAGRSSSPAREGVSAPGADLTDRALAPGGGRPDLGQSLDKRHNPLIRALRALPKPVVCAVNGPAAGAGANVALACDIVLAAKSAQFLQAFARIGLIPDAGGTFTLPRLVGEARARALMMLAEPIGAEQAAAWGMIYRAVDDQDLMGEARTIAERLAAGPTHAFGLIKRALAASPGAASTPSSTLSATCSARPAEGRICRRRAGVSGEAARRFQARRPSNGNSRAPYPPQARRSLVQRSRPEEGRRQFEPAFDAGWDSAVCGASGVAG